LVESAEGYAEARDSGSKNMEVVQRTGEIGFWDKLFENELDGLTAEADAAYHG